MHNPNDITPILYDTGRMPQPYVIRYAAEEQRGPWRCTYQHEDGSVCREDAHYAPDFTPERGGWWLQNVGEAYCTTHAARMIDHTIGARFIQDIYELQQHTNIIHLPEPF